MSDSTTNKTDRFLAFTNMLLPIVLIYLGHVYKEVEAKQGIHEKYVEMAIDILKEPADPNKTELRKWAIQVLNEYSEIHIHEEVREHLFNNELPKSQKQPSEKSSSQ